MGKISEGPGLNRLSEMVLFEQGLKFLKNEAMSLSRDRMFQAEDKTCSKLLRHRGLRTIRRLMWLKWSKQGRK